MVQTQDPLAWGHFKKLGKGLLGHATFKSRTTCRGADLDPGDTIWTNLVKNPRPCYLSYFKHLSQLVRREKIFYYLLCISMVQTWEPLGRNYLDPISSTWVQGFWRRFLNIFKVFLRFKPRTPCRWANLDPGGHHLNKLGKGPLGHDTIKLQAPEPSNSEDEDFLIIFYVFLWLWIISLDELNYFPFYSLCKIIFLIFSNFIHQGKQPVMVILTPLSFRPRLWAHVFLHIICPSELTADMVETIPPSCNYTKHHH